MLGSGPISALCAAQAMGMGLPDSSGIIRLSVHHFEVRLFHTDYLMRIGLLTNSPLGYLVNAAMELNLTKHSSLKARTKFQNES